MNHQILCLLALAATSAMAQEVTGRIEGRLLTADSVQLADVEVTVSSASLFGTRMAVTDRTGHFRLLALPVGTYRVEARHVGYRPVAVQGVRVGLGRTTSLGDIRLLPSAALLEEIVVSGERAVIDLTTASSGTNLASATFEPLPIDRNFRSIVALVPEANASYLGDEVNIAGSTGHENAYFIDGMNVTDPLYGRTSTNLPYNFVREIQVRTGGYEAEYGRATGGIVNVITESGGNELHGSAFGFLTNDRFSGERSVGLLERSVASFARYDAGFAVGGPIARDRAWFFAAYNPLVEREHLDVFGLGRQEDRRTIHAFAGKLTWRVGPRGAATVTLLGDPSTRDGIGQAIPLLPPPRGLANIDPVLVRIREGGVSTSAQVHYQLSPTLLVEAAASRVQRRDDNQPQTIRGASDRLEVDFTSGVWAGGHGQPVRESSVRTSLMASATLFVRNHGLKGGIEYEEDHLAHEFGGGAGLMLRFGGSDSVLIRTTAVGSVRNRIPTLYLQDLWEFMRGFRLNVGLRWDGQYLARSDGSVGTAITNQWQPRIGFVSEDVPPLGTSKIFGSYGRFYEQLPLGLVAYAYAPFEQTFIVFRFDAAQNRDVADTLTFGPPAVAEHLRGEYFDEFTLGYERRLPRGLQVGLRGVHRLTREAVEDGYAPDGSPVIGNPGRGPMGHLPRARREYWALEVRLGRLDAGRFRFLGSYVLSRNEGNYAGVFSSDYGVTNAANFGPAFDDAAQVSSGPLPNDRPHVFKFLGWYRVGTRLTAGTFVVWQSGTPLSELGADPSLPFYPYFSFLRPRGRAGRTPSLWDVSVRLTYAPPRVARTGAQSAVILDVFHIGSPRRPVTIDQFRYLSVDASGNQTSPNPTWGQASRYQPPMTGRLGVSVAF